MQEKCNFIILDEPTNHIDIFTKTALEEALTEYTGTILFVSHDRYFINKLADKIIYINDHKIKEISYDMNYKPIVGGPEYEANVENENISQEVTNEDNSDLSDMFSGADDNNDEKEQENENKNEKNKENSGKKMVMTYNNYNENGFASSYFFIFAAIFIIIIFVVIYIVLGELI